jgi:hypothetical protein
MAMRTAKEMKMHEMIIKSVAGIYEQKGAAQVLTNLMSQNAVVNGITLDLIVKSPFTIYMKVETDTSVTEGESIAWKGISEKLGTFFLLVPEPLKQEALRIQAKAGIKNIRMCYYKIADNKMKFTNLP